MSTHTRLNYRSEYLRSSEVSYESLDYKSFFDVLAVVESVLVIDLSKYAKALPPVVLEESIPSPEGLYFSRSIEPIYSFVNPHTGNQQGLVSAHQAEINPTVCDILSYEDFINCAEPVYRGDTVGRDGKLKLFCRSPRAVSKFFTSTPGELYTGANLLKIEVWNRLLYRDSLCLPISNLPPSELDESSYLTREGRELYRENYPSSFDAVINRVDEFIGKDIHHLLTMRINDCELIIEKGLDYRVVEYYRQIFEHLDAIRMDEEGC